MNISRRNFLGGMTAASAFAVAPGCCSLCKSARPGKIALQLYSLNKGTVTVPLTMDGRPVAGNEGQAGLFASGVFDSSTSEYIIKIANTADSPSAVSILFDGLSGTLSEGVSYTLHCDEPYMDNTLEEPDAVVPEESKIVPSKGRLKVKVGARTFAVYRIPVK